MASLVSRLALELFFNRHMKSCIKCPKCWVSQLRYGEKHEFLISSCLAALNQMHDQSPPLQRARCPKRINDVSQACLSHLPSMIQSHLSWRIAPSLGLVEMQTVREF